MQFLHCKQNSHCKQNQNCRGIRNIATFILSSLLFWIPQTNTENIVPFKKAPKIGEFAESATILVESRTIFGIHKQIRRHVYNSIELSRNPQLYVESANCKCNPQIVGGIRKL